MAATVKSYFLAPNWDYQKDGPLALGDIISDPRDPVFTKLSAFSYNIYSPPSTLPASAASMPVIYKNPPEEWFHVDTQLRNGQLGIFARFLNSCGVSGGASVSHGTYRESNYSMESIQTSYIVPDPGYLRKRLRDPDVALWIEGRGLFRSKSLYMITGVKIARGLVQHKAKSARTDVSGGITSDATPVGVPIQVGLNGEYVSQNSDETTSKSSTDIVFAYQLRKVKEKNAGISNKPFNTGAFLSTGGQSQSSQPLPDFEFDDHDAVATDIDGEDQPSVQMVDVQDILEGQECNVVLML